MLTGGTTQYCHVDGAQVRRLEDRLRKEQWALDWWRYEERLAKEPTCDVPPPSWPPFRAQQIGFTMPPPAEVRAKLDEAAVDRAPAARKEKDTRARAAMKEKAVMKEKAARDKAEEVLSRVAEWVESVGGAHGDSGYPGPKGGLAFPAAEEETVLASGTPTPTRASFADEATPRAEMEKGWPSEQCDDPQERPDPAEGVDEIVA